MTVHQAAKAIIVDNQGRVLLLRKSQDDIRHAGNSGRYNLPGGKVSSGEDLKAALAREVHEETGLIVEVGQPVFSGTWHPVIEGKKHTINGTFFVCSYLAGSVTLDTEHDHFVWVNRENVSKFDILAPEDKALQTYFSF